MSKYVALPVLLALGLSACSARNATPPTLTNPNAAPFGYGITYELPNAALPKHTIGLELPSEGVGSRKDPKWGTVGGYTQTTKAQVLGFPPGTKITIHNLSKVNQHTLNVVGVAHKPPAQFPANPSLSFSAKNHGKLELGYASGIINPGKSVTVNLVKAGTYLIGCAFHYNYGTDSMRDVLIVKKGAKPGPLDL